MISAIKVVLALLISLRQVPNEMGSLEPLRGYQGEDIEIQLPGSLTVYDIDWLAVWCVEYRHNFGHVYIPKDLDVPPALGQTKIQVMRPIQLHLHAAAIVDRIVVFIVPCLTNTVY